MPPSADITTRKYDRAEKDAALTAYALAVGSGNIEKVVVEILKEQDLEIPLGTIRGWAYSKQRDRYMQIREEVADFTRAQIADDAAGYAALAGQVVRKGLEQLEVALDAGTITLKELPKVVHEAAVAHGIGVDKAEKLNDRPTTRVAIDIGGTLRELKEMGMEVEVIDAEVVEDDEPAALLPADE
jgi:hypothetical protein